MRAPADLPEGFVASNRGRLTLILDSRHAVAFERAGLTTPEGWERRLDAPPAGSGRGATGRIDIEGPGAVRIKGLRRGGLTAALWADRFAGPRRALDNLRVPVEAGRRGVPTAAPVALLIERGPAGLVRAWLAVEEIEHAVDLRSQLAAGLAADDELDATLRMVRAMHDRGVEHRDLNLGNLLVRPGSEPESFVIDLDRARLHPGACDFPARQRALRRLERSYVKLCHPSPACDAIRQRLYEGYAAGDDALSRRLARGRPTGRLLIAIHRLGWRH